MTRHDAPAERRRAKYNISTAVGSKRGRGWHFRHRLILLVYQYPHFLNYTDTPPPPSVPRAFPLMDSLDQVQPGPPTRLGGGKKTTDFSNNIIIKCTHAALRQHLSSVPFNCQMDICSCQSPAHCIICNLMIIFFPVLGGSDIWKCYNRHRWGTGAVGTWQTGGGGGEWR